MKTFLSFLFLLTVASSGAQDTMYMKVHFLYGSRPLSKHRSTEPRWFGGMLGGHVGIEADSGRILNFSPLGNFHVFASRRNRHSRFAIHDAEGFYSILGGKAADAKKLVVHIPVTKEQKQKFDSISAGYLSKTPYDYAFIGMRCGAATYEILAKLGILKKYTHAKTYQKIFYPKKLRKRLLKKAKDHNWRMEREAGTERRKWEDD